MKVVVKGAEEKADRKELCRIIEEQVTRIWLILMKLRVKVVEEDEDKEKRMIEENRWAGTVYGYWRVSSRGIKELRENNMICLM